MRYFNVEKKYGNKLAIGAAATLAAPLAMAQETGTDYSSLTAAVDWTSVGTALIAVGAALIGVRVIMKGVRLIVSAVR